MLHKPHVHCSLWSAVTSQIMISQIMVIAGWNKIKFENSLYNYKNLTTQDFHLNRKGQKLSHLYGINRTSRRKSFKIWDTTDFSVNWNIFCLPSMESGTFKWPKTGKTSCRRLNLKNICQARLAFHLSLALTFSCLQVASYQHLYNILRSSQSDYE